MATTYSSTARLGRKASLATTLMGALLLTAAGDASALLGDSLELYVAETVTHDSNLFRLSKDRDANAFLGTSQRSDTYNTTTAGFNLDMPVSRQRFQAGFAVNQVHYSHFSDLDYTGHNGHAQWLWQAGNQWSGQLGYTEALTLGSFANFQGRRSNLIKVDRFFGNATYLITPSWQLQAGLAEQSQRNRDVTRNTNDVDISSADVSLSYVSPSSNRIGLTLRQDEGSYLHRQLVGGNFYDNGYTQRAGGLAAQWAVTGKSRLDFRLERVQRDFDQLAQRNYTGTIYRAAYDWKATGKFSLMAVAQRDISSTEDIRTSFVLVRGVSLVPTWDLTDKIKISGNVDYSTRDYLGDPGLVLGTLSGRTDRVRTVGLNLAYRPTRSVSVLLSGQREARTSNVTLTDYTANIVSLNARLSF